MRILAFTSGVHDASVAAFDDYKLVAAVQEERLRREKNWGGDIPWLAIDDVLGVAGWSRSDVDAIATVRGPLPLRYVRLPLLREIKNAIRRRRGTIDLAVHGIRTATTNVQTLVRTERFMRQNGFRPGTPLTFVNHHEAHALGALFFTDWDEALVYTSDGIGDNVSYGIRSLKGGQLTVHAGGEEWITRRGTKCNSLAFAYAGAMAAAGFRMFRHEGKLTGLSALGKPTLTGQFHRLFRLNGNGLVEAEFDDPSQIFRAVEEICKGARREDIAASVQKLLEDIIPPAVGHWLKTTGVRRLALAGGLFANVRLNRLLAESLPLDEIFIFPAMGDDGLAAGAGLRLLCDRDGVAFWLKQRRRLDNVYFGQDYDGAIDACLAESPRLTRLNGNPATTAVDLIMRGKAGAIYAGRMEYGPRALGARSIIGSPAKAEINDSLNKRLDRSEFMPFAPYVLEEDADRVFEITPVNRYAARFMTITCLVKPEWRDRIPAVVHVDDTARPQIIRDSDNPTFASILREFRSRTGLPVLINTSFNVHEEPIINRPEECRKALLDGRVDFVVTRQAVYAPAQTL